MTHRPMITFRFNGLSTVRGWLGDTGPVQGMHQRGERQEGEGMHIEHGSGESKRAVRDRLGVAGSGTGPP